MLLLAICIVYIAHCENKLKEKEREIFFLDNSLALINVCKLSKDQAIEAHGEALLSIERYKRKITIGDNKSMTIKIISYTNAKEIIHKYHSNIMKTVDPLWVRKNSINL